MCFSINANNYLGSVDVCGESFAGLKMSPTILKHVMTGFSIFIPSSSLLPRSSLLLRRFTESRSGVGLIGQAQAGADVVAGAAYSCRGGGMPPSVGTAPRSVATLQPIEG